MAKKKLSEKTRLFYRGPACNPTMVAGELEMTIISETLDECFTHKSNSFVIDSTRIKYKMVVGLSSGLRNLKQGKSKMIIYDDTAGSHLSNYLNHFASKTNTPIIQANNLEAIAPKFKLNTLLMITFIESDNNREPIRSRALNILHSLLITKSSPKTKGFKRPVLELIKCEGKSQAKKRAKKQRKLMENSQTQAS